MSLPANALDSIPPVLVAVNILFFAGVFLWLRILTRLPATWEKISTGLRWAEWRPVPDPLPMRLFAVYIGSMLIGALFLTRPEYLEAARTTPALPILMNNLLFMAPCVCVILWTYRSFRQRPGQVFNLTASAFPGALRSGIAVYLLVLPVVSLSRFAVMVLLDFFGIPDSMQPVFGELSGLSGILNWLLILVSVVIIAPIAEEMIFRGVLFPYLSARFGVKTGVLISSLIFALIHMHLPTVVPLFILAVGLCLVYVWTRSLLSCMLVHGLFNGVSLLLFLLLPPELGGGL